MSENQKLYIARLGQAWTYDQQSGQWRFDLEVWSEVGGGVTGGRYLPAAETWFEDRRGAHWHAILGVTDLYAPILIDFDLAERAAPFLCFPSAAATRNYFAVATQPGADLVALAATLGWSRSWISAAAARSETLTA